MPALVLSCSGMAAPDRIGSPSSASPAVVSGASPPIAEAARLPRLVLSNLPPARGWSSATESADDVVSPDAAAEVMPRASERHGVCPDDVAGLPSSELYRSGDRRLQSDALVVVHKSGRRLMVFSSGQLQHCFAAGLGFSPEGHKAVEGDGRTPEGWYRTSDKPWSTFDGAIAIHYPNAQDAEVAYRKGRIRKATRDAVAEAWSERRLPPQRTALGGAILIHGGGAASDWTLGCVALEEPDLQILRAALPPGQRTNILILP